MSPLAALPTESLTPARRARTSPSVVVPVQRLVAVPTELVLVIVFVAGALPLTFL